MIRSTSLVTVLVWSRAVLDGLLDGFIRSNRGVRFALVSMGLGEVPG